MQIGSILLCGFIFTKPVKSCPSRVPTPRANNRVPLSSFMEGWNSAPTPAGDFPLSPEVTLVPRVHRVGRERHHSFRGIQNPRTALVCLAKYYLEHILTPCFYVDAGAARDKSRVRT
jgi:hypothetical protein